jgi:hypothetical protein
MLERWRRWSWKRYERRVSTSDDFKKFQRLFSGPITPDLASKMPLEVLLERRTGEAQESRAIIDGEINRRLNSIQPMIANIISVVALIVAAIALAKAW